MRLPDEVIKRVDDYAKEYKQALPFLTALQSKRCGTMRAVTFYHAEKDKMETLRGEYKVILDTVRYNVKEIRVIRDKYVEMGKRLEWIKGMLYKLDSIDYGADLKKDNRTVYIGPDGVSFIERIPLPCPCCGSDSEVLMQQALGTALVECVECELSQSSSREPTGRWELMVAEVVALWNKRQ